MASIEWPLCQQGRQVRFAIERGDARVEAPCGCDDSEQRCFAPDVEEQENYVECLNCGAVWDSREGDEWAHIDSPGY